MNEQTYVGGELELFAQAHLWKRYWISHLLKFIQGDVLEVGAGLGSNTVLLRTGAESRWVCLEPDPALAGSLQKRTSQSPACRNSEVRIGTLKSLPRSELFDTILYIDVLEHIENDQDEVRQAAEHLNSGGRLVVLSPAHGWLFSPFDRAIGHYRRYVAPMLRGLTPPTLRVERVFYLDSVGLLASAANRFLLRQTMPTARQIATWDKFMVPLSRVLDPLTGYRLGKTVICVWKRTN